MRRTGRFQRVFLLVLVSVLAPCVGCQQEEPIVSYRVKKHDLIQIPLDGPDASTESAPLTIEDPTHRMLAAMILKDQAAWFIKGMAPVADFADNTTDAFDKLLTSLDFAEPEKPKWDLGDAWKEQPGSGMRYANLQLGDVQFSVIKLPLPPGPERKYILDNVNRWRGQVGLGPLTSAQLSQMSYKVKTADDLNVTVVDLKGKQSSAAMAPMAGGGRPGMRPGMNAGPRPGTGAPPSGAAASTGSSAFTGTTPDNWTEQKAGMMQLAKYTVEHDGATATISVSQAGGGVKANIDRWRGQVGLKPLESEDDIEAEAIQVSGEDSMYIPIAGEAKSITVAMVPRGRSVWFFKLMGDSAAVEKEAAAFREYLSTIKFK